MAFKISDLLTPEEIKCIKEVRLIDITEICHYLDISDKTVRRWIKRGILPCKKRYGKYVIRADTFMDTQLPSSLWNPLQRRNDDQ